MSSSITPDFCERAGPLNPCRQLQPSGRSCTRPNTQRHRALAPPPPQPEGTTGASNSLGPMHRDPPPMAGVDGPPSPQSRRGAFAIHPAAWLNKSQSMRRGTAATERRHSPLEGHLQRVAIQDGSEVATHNCGHPRRPHALHEAHPRNRKRSNLHGRPSAEAESMVQLRALRGRMRQEFRPTRDRNIQLRRIKKHRWHGYPSKSEACEVRLGQIVSAASSSGPCFPTPLFRFSIDTPQSWLASAHERGDRGSAKPCPIRGPTVPTRVPTPGLPGAQPRWQSVAHELAADDAHHSSMVVDIC